MRCGRRGRRTASRARCAGTRLYFRSTRGKTRRKVSWSKCCGLEVSPTGCRWRTSNRAAPWEKRRKRRWLVLDRRRPSQVATCDCPVGQTRRRQSGRGWTRGWPRPRRPRSDDRRGPQRRDHRLRSLQRDNYPSPRGEHQPTCRRRRDDQPPCLRRREHQSLRRGNHRPPRRGRRQSRPRRRLHGSRRS